MSCFSNSCDISTDDERILPSKIVFQLIIKSSAIEARFKQLFVPAKQRYEEFNAMINSLRAAAEWIRVKLINLIKPQIKESIIVEEKKEKHGAENDPDFP